MINTTNLSLTCFGKPLPFISSSLLYRRMERKLHLFHNRSTTNRTSIHRHQTPPRYRNAARGSRFTVVQPPCFAIRPITAKRDVIHKPEVHNISQRRQRRTEPRPQGIRTKNFVKIGPAVPQICSRTDRQTDRQTDRNTPMPYRGGVTSCSLSFSTQ